jgi:hypothetical protein
LPEEQKISHWPGGGISWCPEAAGSLFDESFQGHGTVTELLGAMTGVVRIVDQRLAAVGTCRRLVGRSLEWQML